jgi:hypothetical protein
MAIATTTFAVEEFNAVIRNTLRGFCKVRLPSGMIIADVAVHVRDGRAWASPPSKPMLNRDSVQMKGADGKPLWSPIISFASRELSNRWSDAVVAALRQSHPHALDEHEVAP